MRAFAVAMMMLLLACGGQEKQGEKQTAQRPNPHHVTNLIWTAPDGWEQQTPSSSMRIAEYRLPKVSGDSEDAILAVFHFPGQGGDVQSNIARWIEQFQQPDGSASSEHAKTEKFQIGTFPVTVVDITGTYLFQASMMSPEVTPKPDFQMLAAIVETEGGPWFFKLIGPQKTVARWQKSFHDFLKSVKAEKTTS